VEQNLWDDEEEEGDSWQSFDTGDDWDAASYLNELTVAEPVLAAGFSEDEHEDMTTPGRTLDHDGYFPPMDLKAGQQIPNGLSHSQHAS
jgi:hypothetical protein